MQLYRKDIPFCSAFSRQDAGAGGGEVELRCKAKAEIDRAVKIADPALRDWYFTTEDRQRRRIDVRAGLADAGRHQRR